jgi:hypothetical protein
VDQAELIELVTETKFGVEIVREGDSCVFAVIKRKLRIEIGWPYCERIRSVEHSGCSVPVRAITRGNRSKFLNDCRWDDDLVPGETEFQWIGILVSNDSEAHEGGSICNKPGHLCVSSLVEEIFVQLLF